MGFKENLTQLRKNSDPKISQEDVARVLGITRPTYRQLEAGERTPSNAELQAISELFGVRIEELLNDDESLKANSPSLGSGIERGAINETKYRNLILYLAEKVGAKPNVGETVFYKLIYFVETLSLFKLGESIAGEQFYKRQYGPVPASFKSLTNEMIAANQLDKVSGEFYTYMQTKYLPRVSSAGLSDDEKLLIDQVISFLGDKTATELSDLSHEDKPWIDAKDGDIMNLNLIFETPRMQSVLMARVREF